MKISDVSPKINTHIQTYKKNKNSLYKLGLSVTSKGRKAAFILVQIFACFTLVGIIPAFILISRHYKKVGLQTLQNDNKQVLNAIFEKTFSTEELKDLCNKKLLITNRYLGNKEIDAIRAHFEQKPKEETAEDTELSESQINHTPPHNDDTSVDESDNDGNPSSTNGTEESQTSTHNTEDSEEVEESSEDTTIDETEEEPQDPVQELQTLLIRSLPNTSSEKNEDYEKDLQIIGEKAAVTMQEKGWTARETVERLLSVFGRCLDRNNDGDHHRAVRHLKEAFDPTIATAVFGIFGTDTQKRNEETLGWFTSDVA